MFLELFYLFSALFTEFTSDVNKKSLKNYVNVIIFFQLDLIQTALLFYTLQNIYVQILQFTMFTRTLA